MKIYDFIVVIALAAVVYYIGRQRGWWKKLMDGNAHMMPNHAPVPAPVINPTPAINPTTPATPTVDNTVHDLWVRVQIAAYGAYSPTDWDNFNRLFTGSTKDEQTVVLDFYKFLDGIPSDPAARPQYFAQTQALYNSRGFSKEFTEGVEQKFDLQDLADNYFTVKRN